MIYKINIESILHYITVKNITIIYMEVRYQYVVHLILFFFINFWVINYIFILRLYCIILIIPESYFCNDLLFLCDNYDYKMKIFNFDKFTGNVLYKNLGV